MGADDAGYAVRVGDGQRLIAKLGGADDKLIGVRGAFEEREVGLAVQLGIGDGAFTRVLGGKVRLAFVGFMNVRHAGKVD